MTLAIQAPCYHVVSMGRTRAALEKVLRRIPGSIRGLAREAGIAHATLIQVRDGDRPLSAGAQARLVRALRRWAKTCDEFADELEAANGERE